MKYKLTNLYIALVVVIAVSSVFHSLMQLSFRQEREQAVGSALRVSYSAKLAAGMEDAQYDEIVSLTASINGVQAADREFPIPPFEGTPEQEKQWESMWREYLPSVLYATAELQVSQINLAPQIAQQIASVSGVEEVLWDQDNHRAQAQEITGLESRQSYLSFWIFLLFAAEAVALTYSFPFRLRRSVVVRTGLGGAGSQVNPEKIWGRMIGEHATAALALYAVLFLLGYLAFPLPLLEDGPPGFGALLIRGGVTTALLVAAVCVAGWWLPVDDRYDLNVHRPPTVD